MLRHPMEDHDIDYNSNEISLGGRIIMLITTVAKNRSFPFRMTCRMITTDDLYIDHDGDLHRDFSRICVRG